MQKIKRFIECLLPITACNLKCSYCYVMQRGKRDNKQAELKYSPEQIGQATTMERWGGCCYFSICGAGETTLQKEIDVIAFNILKNGHYVNITTNGTITSQIEKILKTCHNYSSRIHFSFSFHYIELKKKGLVDVFFHNIELVKNAGASFIVQFNMCDEYIPYLDEIRSLCLENVHGLPQIAATRKERIGLRKIELLTSYDEAEYKAFGDSFDSPLFDFTMQNFNKKRHEFCYAGDWAFNLDISTGIMRRCYCSYLRQDVFKNPNEKIKVLAIGNGCGSPFCMNSSHFLSLGVIPSINSPSYADLRNREEAGWYTEEMKAFLSTKLCESNIAYPIHKKIWSDIVAFFDNSFRIFVQIIRRIIKK